MSSSSIYKSSLCSCILCREIKSVKGIHSHYLAVHGTTTQQLRQKSGINHGSYITKTKQQKLAIAKQEEYIKTPKHCQYCNSLLPYSKRTRKYCSLHCSASANNSNRAPRTEESKLKTANSVKAAVVKYTKISKCNCCNRWFAVTSYKTKYCSSICRSKIQSESMSNRLKDPNYRKIHNIGRSKRSYLEQSFSAWLNQKNVIFEEEKSFRNEDINKTYFADFVLPRSKVIIELDGSQHTKTIEQDAIRDAFITKTYGYTIYRITHKEYQSKVKLPLIEELVARETGLEPA